jgi:alanyl-tRNA synthetase
MAIDHKTLRATYIDFLTKHGHKQVPAIPLVPQNDPTTLFTGSGMQQFVPNLLGEPHPQGTRLVNVQPCLRAQDIDEVGDNRHGLFFEMMGNWSLGDYFKREQLTWFFTFLTEKLKLDPEKIWVTVFAGEDGLPKDDESIAIWQELFLGVGIEAKLGERIRLYDATKNWWSRAGVPANMPSGEPGGPDSEVFYEFTQVKHDPTFGATCHQNCDCGHFLEIGNSVFMQYIKQDDGSFAPLPAQNVDFGGGLERLTMAAENSPDAFATGLYQPLVKEVESITGKAYTDDANKPAMRIIADHLKASVFLIKDGVLPSNKEQGYVLRRLLRRLTIKLRALKNGQMPVADDVAAISRVVLEMYDGVYFDAEADAAEMKRVIGEEIAKFTKTLERGKREIEKMHEVDGKIAFDLYQSYGFPLEVTEEILTDQGKSVDRDQFYAEFQKHKDLSRSSSAGKFKGGLADHSDQVVKYHTATHLLHQALFDIYGDDIRQEGSNITGERLRFDFFTTQSIDKKQDVPRIEEIINGKIREALPMRFKLMDKKDAEKVGARSFFREKYPDRVKVYYIGGEDERPETAYSKEFCGGPHVSNTREIGSLTIQKLEKIGSNLYRIYAK